MPPYRDNVKVHTDLGCPCLEGVAQEGVVAPGWEAQYQGQGQGETPSKVRRISGDESQESPAEKQTA